MIVINVLVITSHSRGIAIVHLQLIFVPLSQLRTSKR